jgi:hypothetical protein
MGWGPGNPLTSARVRMLGLQCHLVNDGDEGMTKLGQGVWAAQ